MRYGILVVSIVLAFAVSGFAASSAALPYDLKLSAPLGSISSQSKVVTGSTFGGVPVTGAVQGTTTSGTLNLFADGKLFVTGTYSCSSGCTFSGTIAGKTVSGMSLSKASSFTGKTSSTATTAMGKATSSAFPNHGAWVSSVAGWANTNLTGSQRGHITSSAAKIEGPLASGKTDRGQASGQAGNGKNANDRDDGKGGGKGKP
jgi:hypothetical protein